MVCVSLCSLVRGQQQVSWWTSRTIRTHGDVLGLPLGARSEVEVSGAKVGWDDIMQASVES